MIRLTDCDQAIARRLVAAVDVACQSCFHRRRFVLQAQDLGLEVAYKNWRDSSPILNTAFRDVADSLVRQLCLKNT